MTPIAVFRKDTLRTSLIRAAFLLSASLLALWLAHEASAKYPREMAVITAISAAAAIYLLFHGIYLIRNALLRKPLLWTDGVHLIYLTPYEVRIPLADIVAYRFDCGRKRAAPSPVGVKLILQDGKRRYLPLSMAETSDPLVSFLRYLISRRVP